MISILGPLYALQKPFCSVKRSSGVLWKAPGCQARALHACTAESNVQCCRTCHHVLKPDCAPLGRFQASRSAGDQRDGGHSTGTAADSIGRRQGAHAPPPRRRGTSCPWRAGAASRRRNSAQHSACSQPARPSTATGRHAVQDHRLWPRKRPRLPQVSSWKLANHTGRSFRRGNDSSAVLPFDRLNRLHPAVSSNLGLDLLWSGRTWSCICRSWRCRTMWSPSGPPARSAVAAGALPSLSRCPSRRLCVRAVGPPFVLPRLTVRIRCPRVPLHARGISPRGSNAQLMLCMMHPNIGSGRALQLEALNACHTVSKLCACAPTAAAPAYLLASQVCERQATEFHHVYQL